MIEAVMFWNEPNNKSHWDFEVDPDWQMFAAMVKLAAEAVRAENPKLPRVLGGISPIDADFMTFSAEEVQEFGLRRSAELLIDRVPRIHWYSLYDLPAA